MYAIRHNLVSLKYVFTICLAIILRILSSYRLSKVCSQIDEKMDLYKELISSTYPIRNGTYAVTDRLELYLEQAVDTIIQKGSAMGENTNTMWYI